MPAHSDQLAIVWSADSIRSTAATSSLSAIGSSIRPMRRLLGERAREIAVEEIRDAGDDEDAERRPPHPGSSGQNSSATTTGTATMRA